MNKDSHAMLCRLHGLGIGHADALALRRIAMQLHRWHELECGTDAGYITRDESTGIPYIHYAVPPFLTRRMRDMETGALKRLTCIMGGYPSLQEYVQGDPRGASLYILHKDSLADGASIDSVYSSRGVAVYK